MLKNIIGLTSVDSYPQQVKRQIVNIHRPHKLASLCLVVLGLCALGNGAAFATAEEEPSQHGMAPATSHALDVGPIAMMETSEAPWASGRAASQAFGSSSNGQSEQLMRHAMRVTNYIQARNRHLATDEAGSLARVILQFSSQYGVDYRLLTSIIAIESSFRRDAVSSSGAIGMGQLKPATAKWLGVSNPYDPVDNIAGTARFISWLMNRYNGRLEYAISAYYQGPGHVDRNGITPVCMPYLQKVNQALGGLL